MYIFMFQAILLGLGLQRKSVDELAEELNLPATQLLGLFNRLIRKATQHLNSVAENYVNSTMLVKRNVNQNINVEAGKGKSLHEELEAADKVRYIMI